MKDSKYNYDYSEKINTDYHYESKPSKVFEISPFSITEIQYLRGLIMNDKLSNNYEKEGMHIRIDRKTSMHDFTGRLLKILDGLEDGCE